MRSPVVVSYGGGIDSFAVLIGMRDRGERPDAIVFADTGGEKPETYAYLGEHLNPWLARWGFPRLTTVRRPDFGRSKTGDKTLEDECLRLGTPPSRAFGFSTCADKWKIDPFNWYARLAFTNWRGWPAEAGWAGLTTPLVVLVGFEYGEEKRISAFTERGQLKRYPLIEWKWDRDACEAAILGEGLPLPIKSACFFCPSSTKNEVLWLAKTHPDLATRALAIESHANAQVDPDTGLKRWSVLGLGRRFAWADLISADAAAREQFPDAPVEACTKCNDGGCEVSP
jgi:hypothetical protein